MYSQLGNFIFEGLFGFESFQTNDTTNYAEHALINAKPVLRPTGNNLEEISIGIHLHASFCRPEKTILGLKEAKDNYEILPLIKGNGRFMGEWVILEMSVTDVQSFADGTTIEANVSLTLKEYASTDKLQQQQAAARKQAFATNVNRVFNVGSVEPPTASQLAAKDMTALESQAAKMNNIVTSYNNNVSAQPVLERNMQKSLLKITDGLTALNGRLPDLPYLSNLPAIQQAIQDVQTQVQAFVFPVVSVSDLDLYNDNLQAAMQQLSLSTTDIINAVITRAA